MKNTQKKKQRPLALEVSGTIRLELAGLHPLELAPGRHMEQAGLFALPDSILDGLEILKEKRNGRPGSSQRLEAPEAPGK